MTSSARIDDRVPSRRVVLGALALGLLFEVVNVVGTQEAPVFAVTPWHDDPFHAVTLAAVFTVAMLIIALAARLLVWTAPGGPDRAGQMDRAGGVLAAVIAVAAGFQWTAVALGDRSRIWDGATAVQIGALAVACAGAAGVGFGVLAARASRGPVRRWEHDWLGDLALLAARVPRFGRAAPPALLAWVRRRALTVFATLSLLAATPIVIAQSVGEGWTDPVLIGWAFAVLTATLFAFCVIANALAGFVARPARSPRSRSTEAALVAGCLGIQFSEAFHDQLWRALTGHPVVAVGSLVVLTGGAGVAAASVCGAALALTARRRGRLLGPGPGVTGAGRRAGRDRTATRSARSW